MDDNDERSEGFEYQKRCETFMILLMPFKIYHKCKINYN